MARYGRYSLVGKLATGGMAEVFLAKAEGPGGFEKKLVLKRIRPQFAEKASIVRMFLAEARIAAQFDHQNIVQIFDFGEAEGAHYLAMEFIDGLDLRALMRWAMLVERPIPFTAAARIISQACDGLAYAHEFADPQTREPMRLIHRDISPENIILSRGGAVKVLDFGVAKVEGDGDQTRAGAIKGKVAYMPLERVRDEPVDQRIDVYGLGVVLYQLLTGHKPYEQQPEVAMIAAILNGPPPTVLERRPEVPPELAAIVEKAMARDRDQRYSTCRQLHADLEAFISSTHEPVGASHLAELVAQAQASGLLGAQLVWSSSDDSVGSAERRTSPRNRGIEGAGSQTATNAPPAASVPQMLTRGFDAPRPPMPSDDEPLGLPVAVGHPPISTRAALLETRPAGTPAVAAPPSSPRPRDGASSSAADAPGLAASAVAASGGAVAGVAASGAASGVSRLPSSAPRPADASTAAPQPPSSAPRPADASTAAPRPPSSAPRPSDAAAGAPASAPRPLPESVERSAPPTAPRAAVPLGDEPDDTESGLLAMVAEFASPPPTDEPQTASTSPATAAAPKPASANLLMRRPGWVASSAVQEGLRQAAAAERSRLLVRKFPVLAARLLEANAELPPSVREPLEGLLDAAMVSDDWATLKAVIERAAANSHFSPLLRTELSSPVRLAWLVERLRLDARVDAAPVQAWLTALGEAVVPMLLWAIEASDGSPGQDLLCRALAPRVAADPSAVVARLEAPGSKHVAAWCLVLEVGQAVDRQRVFHKLLARRQSGLTMQVMTGRARAQTSESFVALESGLGDKSEDVRRHALKLLGESIDQRAPAVLAAQLSAAGFENRSLAERSALWAALVTHGQRSLLGLVEQALAQKTTLLNRKKVVEARLGVVEGLASAAGDAAAPMLERLAADKGQPDEVTAAAKAALARVTGVNEPSRPTPERRRAQQRSVCLELFMLVRAATTVDLGTGVLDPGLERLREGLRVLLLQDGRFELSVGPEGLAHNGAPVAFNAPGDELGVGMARALLARDVRGFKLDVPIPLAELRSAFVRQFDPHGAAEKPTHVTFATFSNTPARSPEPPAPVPGDPATRARQLYLSAVVLLQKERETLLDHRAPSFVEAQPLLDEWARLYTAPQPLMLSLLPTRSGDEAFAIEAANVALLSMSFAADLGLGPVHLRELAELALFSTLAEQALPPERRAAPGEPACEDARVRTAWNFLDAARTRRTAAYAVTSIEVGLLTGGEATRVQSVQASILALAQAWDSLARAGKLGHEQALVEMTGKLRKRFHPELLGLFTLWARHQLG